jgi:hypothetical protein
MPEWWPEWLIFNHCIDPGETGSLMLNLEQAPQVSRAVINIALFIAAKPATLKHYPLNCTLGQARFPSRLRSQAGA